MANQFYITLPSNSTKENTASNFITTLPRHVKLEGEWQVGLVEIIYGNTWDNVGEKHNMIRFKADKMRTLYIPSGRYHTIEDLIKLMNHTINDSNMGKDLQFEYNKTLRRCQITLNKNVIKDLYISNHLSYMLGFSDKVINLGAKIIAPYAPDMLGGLHNMYVYCDLVEPQIVGNTFTPLIQVVNVEGKYMDIINHSYISPHYIPVLKKDFDSIEINVKTDHNTPIPFQFGKTIVKLHFKKVQ